MFKIALVQSMSELRSYSYADIRRELSDMGFEVWGITRDNIETMIPMMSDSLDCILFSSNSMHDEKIYDYICKNEFAEAFHAYLDKKGAAVILHQYKLHTMENPFPFLGQEGLRLEKKYEGAEKNHSVKEIFLDENNVSSRQYFVFPNKVSLREVNANCAQNIALRGYYWQLLRGSENDWSSILVDKDGNPVIRRMNNRKVVFSSLLLDYQSHLELLENVLLNLMVENKSLAILERESSNKLGFNYFLNSLENKKLYYKRYKDDHHGMSELMESIKLGIHSSILINGDEINDFPRDIKNSIREYGVKLIQIKEGDKGADSFAVHAVDRSISLEFSNMELEIEKKLSKGLISNSFMKTVEILMKLKELEAKNKTKGTYNEARVSHVLEEVKKHIEDDGSYDETFGASCKALWMFATFYGKKNKYTQNCKEYVQKYDTGTAVRESLEKYYILSMFETDPVRYMRANCAEIIRKVIDNDFESITEYDFLTIVKAALEMQEEAVLLELFEYIKKNVKITGEFFNLYVTSVVSSYLIDLYYLVQNQQKKEQIRKLLFDIIIYMKTANRSQLFIEEEVEYICALYKFEFEVSFPVSDVTEVIVKTGNFPGEYQACSKQIRIYEQFSERMDGVVQENKCLSLENKKLKVYKKGFFAFLTLFVLMLYVSVYLLMIIGDAQIPLIETLFDKIKESWFSLFSIVVIPVVTFIFNRFLKKEEDKE